MVYWFTEFPVAPERFVYHTAQYQEDGSYLGELIREIAGRRESVFPLTTEERRCRLCHYRSFCRRGIRAGLLDEAEEPEDDDFGLTFDLEQLTGFEY